LNKRPNSKRVSAANGAVVPPPKPLKIGPPSGRPQGRENKARRTSLRKAPPVPFLAATRRGILARKVVPPDNKDLEEREYAHLRAQLDREFSPRTITEHNAVDMLALDYIRLARTTWLDEASSPSYPSERRYVADAEEALEVAKVLAQQADAAEPFQCPPHCLQTMAELLSGRARQFTWHKEPNTYDMDMRKFLSDYALKHGFKPAQESPDDGAEKRVEREPSEEELRHRALGDEIDPDAMGATDRGRMESILSGAVRDPEHQERWKLLTHWYCEVLERELSQARDADDEYRREVRTRYPDPVRHVLHLERVQRYEGHLQKSIAVAIEFLEARRSARQP
jgi:hypothetical protein